MRERPLEVLIEDEELVIRIGINTLAFAFEEGEDNNPFDENIDNFRKAHKVTDPDIFAKEVYLELIREREDGSTPVTDLLDKMFSEALDMGCQGIEEPK